MEKKYGLLIICTVVMLASVFAAFIPVGTAKSQGGGNFNLIENKTGLQKVLIGQNLEFDNFSTPVVYRVVSGDIENTYPADSGDHIYNVNWPTSGAFYVNYRNSSNYDAQLSVEAAIIPLELRVGTTKVSFIAVGTTPLKIDTAGINLFDEDVVDLVIHGPEGQISYDSVNDQQFTGINVSKLKEYGTGTVGLNTSGLQIGNYTFQVKTVSGKACGLEAESAEKSLYRGIVYHEPSSPTPVPTSEVEVEVTPLSPTPTATPSVTTVPTSTASPTPTPTPTASPTVSVTPTPTPTPTPSTPGFGFLFAITGVVVVLAAIYLSGRRR